MPHQSVDVDGDPEVGRDAVQLDEVGEVEAATHHGVVCGQHLRADHLGVVPYQQDEVEHRVI